MLRRALVCLLVVGPLVLAVSCTGPADPDPQAQERLHAAAAPLVTVHDLLARYADAVAAGGDYREARAMWPQVTEQVEPVLDAYDPTAADLGPAARSALVGYLGGLRAGVDAWGRVAAAIRAEQADQTGTTDDLDRRVEHARAHMRRLDSLRAAALPAGADR